MSTSNITKKRQTRAVGVAGGFINQVMGNNSTEPKVGEGATILMYSDREPYEVIEVAEDGMSCVIRSVNSTFVGSGYGDERYTYESDPEGYTLTLEWNEKKGTWGKVSRTIEIMKSLRERLFKQYGFGWENYLPNGVKFDDLIDGERRGLDTKYKFVKGITREYKNFSPVSIIFGRMEKYRDPSF